MTEQLTESLEDYLEAIAELIVVEGHAHTKEIADKLHVKMPSVTSALIQLEKKKYIIYSSNHPVILTENGKKIAEEILHRHIVLKKFFTDILHLSDDKASETACHLEHVVDSDTVRRFVLFSEAIENRKDAESLKTYLTEAMSFSEQNTRESVFVLSEAHPGENLIVEKIGANLENAGDAALAAGDKILCRKTDQEKSAVTVSRGNEMISLDFGYAENIWVSRNPEN